MVLVFLLLENIKSMNIFKIINIVKLDLICFYCMKIINLYLRFFKVEYNICKNILFRNIISVCLMFIIC